MIPVAACKTAVHQMLDASFSAQPSQSRLNYLISRRSRLKKITCLQKQNKCQLENLHLSNLGFKCKNIDGLIDKLDPGVQKPSKTPTHSLC